MKILSNESKTCFFCNRIKRILQFVHVFYRTCIFSFNVQLCDNLAFLLDSTVIVSLLRVLHFDRAFFQLFQGPCNGYNFKTPSFVSFVPPPSLFFSSYTDCMWDSLLLSTSMPYSTRKFQCVLSALTLYPAAHSNMFIEQKSLVFIGVSSSPKWKISPLKDT